MMNTQQQESKPTPELTGDKDNNIFSQPWNDSDVVLVVEDKEFHVHRSILSLQSPVFKTMFTGNFKDATQDKIELKDDKYEGMLPFLQLLYPANMHHDYDEVDIDDENVFKILELADKYGAINIIKQCMKEIRYLKPENTMRLLPYAARNKLPCGKIFNVIKRHVSTNKLIINFAPELISNDSHVSIQALVIKCRTLEDATKRANTMLLHLLKKYVEMAKTKGPHTPDAIPEGPAIFRGYPPDVRTQKSRRVVDRGGSSGTPAKCVQHEILEAANFKEARKCENCLTAYKMYIIEKYVFPVNRGGLFGGSSVENPRPPTSNDLIDLLKLTDDIATSLES